MRRSLSNSRRSWSGVRALAVATLVAGLLANGCAGTRLTRSLTTPGELQTLDRRTAYLKVHAKDGQLYVLSQWRADETARQISGRGDRLNLAREVPNRSVHRLARRCGPYRNQCGSTFASGRRLGRGHRHLRAVTAFCIAQPRPVSVRALPFMWKAPRVPRSRLKGFHRASRRHSRRPTSMRCTGRDCLRTVFSR